MYREFTHGMKVEKVISPSNVKQKKADYNSYKA